MTILWIHRGSEFGRNSNHHQQYFSVTCVSCAFGESWLQDSPAHPGGCAAAEGEGGVKQKNIVDIETLRWSWHIEIITSFTWLIFSRSWHLALFFDLSSPFILVCTALLCTNNEFNQWTSLVAFNWPNGALKILDPQEPKWASPDNPSPLMRSVYCIVGVLDIPRDLRSFGFLQIHFFSFGCFFFPLCEGDSESHFSSLSSLGSNFVWVLEVILFKFG